MDINFQGKSALVCGSSQGIGKACAIELANLGANVTLFSRNQTALEQVKAELNTEQGQQHQVLVADFSQPEQVKEVINAHVSALGGYDILINKSIIIKKKSTIKRFSFLRNSSSTTTKIIRINSAIRIRKNYSKI